MENRDGFTDMQHINIVKKSTSGASRPWLLYLNYAVLSGGMTALLLTPGTGICKPSLVAGAIPAGGAADD